MPDPSPLPADVSCVKCGYDLRSLPQDGNCPECGHAIRESLLVWTEARRVAPSLGESDPAWLRKIAEGAVLAVVVCVLVVLVALLPESMYEWKSTPRKWTLGLACATWVLSWAASWRLSTREPNETKHDSDPRIALRWFATAYLAFPFLWGTHRPGYAASAFEIAAFVAVTSGAMGTVAWFMRAGDFAGRAGARFLRSEARIAAWTGGAMFGCCILLVPFHLPIDSLSVLLRHPVLPIGPPDPMGVFGRTWRHGERHEVVCLAAPVAVWMASIAVRLAVLVLGAARAARRAGSSKIA